MEEIQELKTNIAEGNVFQKAITTQKNQKHSQKQVKQRWKLIMLSNLNNLFAKHKQQKSRKAKNKNREDKRKKSNGNLKKKKKRKSNDLNRKKSENSVNSRKNKEGKKLN